MTELRRSKVESLLQQLLSRLISMKTIKDHRVDLDLSVMQVKVSKDGAYADCFISSFNGDKRSAEGTEGLSHAAGFIRRSLAPELKLRKIPLFRFHVYEEGRDDLEFIHRLENLVSRDSAPSEDSEAAEEPST